MKADLLSGSYFFTALRAVSIPQCPPGGRFDLCKNGAGNFLAFRVEYFCFSAYGKANESIYLMKIRLYSVLIQPLLNITENFFLLFAAESLSGTPLSSIGYVPSFSLWKSYLLRTQSFIYTSKTYSPRSCSFLHEKALAQTPYQPSLLFQKCGAIINHKSSSLVWKIACFYKE